MQERFLWHFPYLENIQGVLDGVPRGPVGPPGPPELAALSSTGPMTSGSNSSMVYFFSAFSNCPNEIWPAPSTSKHRKALPQPMVLSPNLG